VRSGSGAPNPHLTRRVAGDGDVLGDVDGDGKPGNTGFAEAVSFQPGAGVEVDQAGRKFVDVERFVALTEPAIDLWSNRARPGAGIDYFLVRHKR
jgi:hypothetical protein